jgi:hypothetical protein
MLSHFPSLSLRTIMLQPSFILSTKANQLVGNAVQTPPYLIQVDASVRNQTIAAGFGSAFDLLPGGGDLSSIGFANMAAVALTFTGTTPITLDLTNLVAATGVVVSGAGTFAGSFASWEQIFFQNVSSSGKNVTVSPGASNPLRTALGGTSPTILLLPNDNHLWVNSAALVVDSTHKTVTLTPSAGGSALIYIGGN